MPSSSEEKKGSAEPDAGGDVAIDATPEKATDDPNSNAETEVGGSPFRLVRKLSPPYFLGALTSGKPLTLGLID